MKNLSEAKLLRIFIGESDKLGNIPLYEALVFQAKKEGLLGATVIKGIMGFGANSKISTAKLFTISQDLPLIVEIVDKEDRIKNFLKSVEQMFKESNSGGLITIEKAEILLYQAVK
jgi:uncharacterized protein